MAIREGRCSNCGSIIRVQDQEAAARCIFCWAETPTDEALALVDAPSDHVFPNLDIEAPDEEERSATMLQQLGISGEASVREIVKSRSPRKVIKETDQLSAVERVKAMAKENKLVKVPNVSAKAMIQMVIVAVLAVALFLLFTFPNYNRYRVQAEELNQLIVERTEIEVDPVQEIRYSGRDFKNALIVYSDGELSEDDAKHLTEIYAGARAELYDHGDDPYRDELGLAIWSDGKAYDVQVNTDGNIDVQEVQYVMPAPQAEDVEELVEAVDEDTGVDGDLETAEDVVREEDAAADEAVSEEDATDEEVSEETVADEDDSVTESNAD